MTSASCDTGLSVETHGHSPPRAATWFLARRLFLGGIAVTYALAFGSLAVQVRGLFGVQGIVPLAARMAWLAEEFQGRARLELPTLFWFGASDARLLGGCGLGFLAAVLAALGLAPRVTLGACWLLYLSFVSVGSPFLDFQWDALLLEAGALAILFAPGGLRPYGRTEGAPSDLVRVLVYGLLAKLMLLSGAAKLLAGDPSWRDGTALEFHWWTQPLPHRLSVLAAEAPTWFQRASVLVMFVLELGLPCLLVVPLAVRRLRALVAAGTLALMLAVFLTGNYGFFNVLTAVLCVPLLDDRAWRRLLFRAPHAVPAQETGSEPSAPWRGWILAAFGLPLALVSLSQVLVGVGALAAPPAPLAALERTLAPLRSVNSYGLFRVMTKERPEIRIEGSADGTTWLPYRFRYKPDDPRRAPVFAGLHMPRLDWQLWFAALEHRSPRRSRWVADLLDRLLEGSASVLALFEANPFPTDPPRFVRASVASMRFAPRAQRADGIWWQRGPSAPFLPTRERPH